MGKTPAKTTLGRQAAGLGRYFMDCGWYRHPRFSGLPVEALFLFEAGIGYSIEHATSGKMPGDLEELSVVLGVRISIVRKGAKALLDAGRWTRQDDTIVTVGFAAHNPTKEEIEAFAEERSKAGLLGNHVRWHEARSVTDPECPFCTTDPDTESLPDRSSDPPSDQFASPQGIANPSHGMGWDGMGTTSSSRQPSSVRSQRPDDDRLESALGAIATAKVDRETARRLVDGRPPIENQAAYQAKTVADLREQHLGEILTLLAGHPQDSPADTADRYLTAPRNGHQAAPAGPPAPRRDPRCHRCRGTGWTYTHDESDTVERCECVAPDPDVTQPQPDLEPFGAPA